MMQHSAVSLSLIYYSTWAFCDTSLSQLAWLHIWWFLICEGKKLELAGVRIQFLLIHSELWYRGWWCTVGWFENNLLTSHVSMVPVTFKETGGGTYETKLLTNSNTVDISSLFTICICMGDVRVDFNSNIWSPSCNKLWNPLLFTLVCCLKWSYIYPRLEYFHDFAVIGENEPNKNSGGSWESNTIGLVNTSQMLLSMSHFIWTHSKEVEPSLLIQTAAYGKWRSPGDGIMDLGGLTVQAHCLSELKPCHQHTSWMMSSWNNNNDDVLLVDLRITSSPLMSPWYQ